MDKFIVSKSLKNTAVYTFYSTIFFIAVFALLPFGQILLGIDLFYAIISGLGFGFGMWTMFKALEHDEASHISPFVGAVVVIATYALSYFFLNETLNSSQQTGLIFLVGASLLLSLERTRSRSRFHKGFLWAIFSGILFAISHVTAKHIYDLYPFITGLIWTKSTIGFVGIITLFIPSVRKHLSRKEIGETPKGNVKTNSTSLVITDKILSIVSVICIQYAIAIGKVTVVNALAGIQYALMFIFIFLLTKLRPKIFYEFFTKKELIVESLAIILVVLGLVFLQ